MLKNFQEAQSGRKLCAISLSKGVKYDLYWVNTAIYDIVSKC